VKRKSGLEFFSPPFFFGRSEVVKSGGQNKQKKKGTGAASFLPSLPLLYLSPAKTPPFVTVAIRSKKKKRKKKPTNHRCWRLSFSLLCVFFLPACCFFETKTTRHARLGSFFCRDEKKAKKTKKIPLSRSPLRLRRCGASLLPPSHSLFFSLLRSSQHPPSLFSSTS
jgi:hypothetical protein